jgi:hypothetical protein
MLPHQIDFEINLFLIAFRLTGTNGEIIVRGKDCDAYPNLTKYSWVHYKKYGKLVAAAVIDDSFVMDKSPLTSAAQRLAQLRPGKEAFSYSDKRPILLLQNLQLQRQFSKRTRLRRTLVCRTFNHVNKTQTIKPKMRFHEIQNQEWTMFFRFDYRAGLSGGPGDQSRLGQDPRRLLPSHDAHDARLATALP